MKVIVVHDGTPDAKAGLAYGMKKVNSTGGELITYRLLRSADLHDEDRVPASVTRRAMYRRRPLQTYHHDDGKKITASIVFADGGADDAILAFAGRIDADLIVAPPSFEHLVTTASCLVDIVTDRRGYFGVYKRPAQTRQEKALSAR